MQITMFDGEQHFKLGQKPIRLIELFAGYGSQSLALDYLGIPYESYRICEWAVKSIQAYKNLHFAEDYFVNGKTQKEIIVDYHITYSNFMGVRKRL